MTDDKVVPISAPRKPSADPDELASLLAAFVDDMTKAHRITAGFIERSTQVHSDILNRLSTLESVVAGLLRGDL